MKISATVKSYSTRYKQEVEICQLLAAYLLKAVDNDNFNVKNSGLFFVLLLK